MGWRRASILLSHYVMSTLSGLQVSLNYSKGVTHVLASGTNTAEFAAQVRAVSCHFATDASFGCDWQVLRQTEFCRSVDVKRMLFVLS